MRLQQKRLHDAKRRAEQPWRKWYSTARWRAKRLAQLANEPLCRFCSSTDHPTPATIADHITPHRGDADLFWNGSLQSLCKPCHDTTKAKDEARGYSTAHGADGWPIDPKHPANTGRL